MSYSLLHISDLHRSVADPIGNEELISTMVADRDRYLSEDPPVPSPDAIIVSGDVIQGAKLGSENYAEDLRNQYEVAAAFLAGLTERFIGGDRSRIIIVPGNHDVDWNTARSAMHLIPEGMEPAGLSPSMLGPESDVRWDWEGRKAYRITDPEGYESRLDAFWSFLTSFYDGVEFVVPPSKNSYYWLAELDQARIGVVALNSCVGNDCFSFHGAISEAALAQAHMQMHDEGSRHELRMAVWHHNIEGTPYASDYMDVDTVYRMIGKGFRLGLHGHQHRGQAAHRYIHLPEAEPMAIVSAGSLCAGRKELPSGVNRQYNVIEFTDGLDRIRVHVREMAIATVFAAARRPEFGGKGYVDLDLGSPPQGLLRAREHAAILEAERAISDGRFVEGLKLLARVDRPPGSFAHVLYLKALDEAQAWDQAAAELAQPETMDEAVLLVRALALLRRYEEAQTALDNLRERLGAPAATVEDLRGWLNAQRQMSQ